MIQLSNVVINFGNKEIKYEIGVKGVKKIEIDQKNRLIKICFDGNGNQKFKAIPMDLLDFYNYD